MSDDELLDVCSGFRDGILDCARYGGKSDGMCYAVSMALGGYLAWLGFECRLIEGAVGRSNHFWLQHPDGRIIDATADQFSTEKRPMPKVYLGSKPKHYRVAKMQGEQKGEGK